MSRPCCLTLSLIVLSIGFQPLAASAAEEPRAKSTEATKLNPSSPLSWPPGKVIFQQSDAAKQIREVLEKPAEFQFGPCTPLGDVITYLKENTKIAVELDAEALAADGKGSELPICKIQKYTSLANGLSLLLGPQGLTYLVKNDVLLITTKTAASAPENLSTRVYQVHDLVVAANDPTALQPDFDSLIDVISSSVRQQDWQDNGGTIGFIKQFNGPGTMALIITHEEQGHREIEQLLKMLREARVQQIVDAQEKQPLKDREPTQVPFVGGVGSSAGSVTPPPTPPGGGMF